MKYIADLLYWIREREQIRYNKEGAKLPPPWTDDAIIANNRWCNVRREDDAVTRWIHRNWLEPFNASPHLYTATAIARLVNLPSTLCLLGFPVGGWHPLYERHFIETFEGQRLVGNKAWTGAYMVTGGFSKGGETKEVIIARVLKGFHERQSDPEYRVSPNDTLAEAHAKLMCPGIGSFLAAQIVADLKASRLKWAPDWETWCAPGPGSTMGLNFIHDRPRTQAIEPQKFIAEVNTIREVVRMHTGIALCAQNTQNCLCELSKYVRAKYFGERLKNTYRPA